jgi:hypothetical protein
VEAADAFGASGRHVELDVGDTAPKRAPGWYQRMRLPRGAGRLHECVVLVKIEGGTIETLAQPGQPLQKSRAIRQHQTEVATQPLRLARRRWCRSIGGKAVSIGNATG